MKRVKVSFRRPGNPNLSNPICVLEDEVCKMAQRAYVRWPSRRSNRVTSVRFIKAFVNEKGKHFSIYEVKEAYGGQMALMYVLEKENR